MEGEKFELKGNQSAAIFSEPGVCRLVKTAMNNLGNHETFLNLADHNNVIRLRIEDHVEDHWSYYDLDNYNGVPTDVPTSVQYRNLKSVSPYR